MSTRPALAAGRKPIAIPDLFEMKRTGRKIVMVTAYDYPSALAAEAADVDMVLVGDSGAMTVLGHSSTVEVTVDEMLVLTRATRRGVSHAMLVADLPFGSYEISDEQAIATAVRFVKEGRVDAVKLERGDPDSVSRARAIVAAGVPWWGTSGSPRSRRPRSAGTGRRAAAPSPPSAITDGLLALQDAGCFSIVLEAVPNALTAGDHAADDRPDHRHRRRPGHRRAGAGVPRPAGHPGGQGRQIRPPLRRPARRDVGRRRATTPARSAR